MKLFNQFADHPFGSWIINVISVIAGILLFKVLTSKFPDAGFPGSIKAAVSAI